MMLNSGLKNESGSSILIGTNGSSSSMGSSSHAQQASKMLKTMNGGVISSMNGGSYGHGSSGSSSSSNASNSSLSGANPENAFADSLLISAANKSFKLSALSAGSMNSSLSLSGSLNGASAMNGAGSSGHNSSSSSNNNNNNGGDSSSQLSSPSSAASSSLYLNSIGGKMSKLSDLQNAEVRFSISTFLFVACVIVCSIQIINKRAAKQICDCLRNKEKREKSIE
jgi:hypothetical protein